ncbi:MAG: four helix bundle protein [Crocosphaera sp.]
MQIALKEARETQYWLKVIIASELVSENRLVSLLNEANELVKIISAIIIKKKRNQK